jgi:hypothetical protein
MGKKSLIAFQPELRSAFAYKRHPTLILVLRFALSSLAPLRELGSRRNCLRCTAEGSDQRFLINAIPTLITILRFILSSLAPLRELAIASQSRRVVPIP